MHFNQAGVWVRRFQWHWKSAGPLEKKRQNINLKKKRPFGCVLVPSFLMIPGALKFWSVLVTVVMYWIRNSVTKDGILTRWWVIFNFSFLDPNSGSCHPQSCDQRPLKRSRINSKHFVGTKIMIIYIKVMLNLYIKELAYGIGEKKCHVSTLFFLKVKSWWSKPLSVRMMSCQLRQFI